MARQGITRDQVFTAADALVGDGQQPTINAIRERLGGTGSPNTIHKHLVQWREARPVAAVAAPELPQALTAAIAGEIEKAAAKARAEKEQELQQAQAEAAELGAAGEALEAERDELAEQVAVLTTERDTLAGKAAQQAADLAEAQQRIEREQQAAENGTAQDRSADRAPDGAGRRDRAPTRRTGRGTAGPHRRRAAGRRAGRQAGGVRRPCEPRRGPRRADRAAGRQGCTGPRHRPRSSGAGNPAGAGRA